MNAPRKYSVKDHKPSDLGGRRAQALFEFRDPYDADDPLATSLYGNWPDSKVKGLLLHVGKRGAVWRFKQHVQINGKRVTHFRTLGRVYEMDVKAARKAAMIFAGIVAEGKAAPGRRTARRFDDAFEAHLAHLKEQAQARGKLPRWHDNAAKLWRDYLKPQWGNWTLAQMSADPRAVADWYRKLAGRVPTTAAHCVRLIRACYHRERRFDRSLPPDPPTSGVKLGKIVTTEKAMAFDRFAGWRKAWDKIASPTQRGYHLAALLTGCRPGELALVRRGDFDRAAHTLTIRNTKNGRDLTIPTTPAIEYALDLALNAPTPMMVQKGLRGMQPGEVRIVQRRRHGEVGIPDLIFPGCRQAPARSTLPAAGHALRHTYKTTAAACGVSDTLSAILLGHALPGISGRYISELAISRSAELRAAQELISERMMQLLGLSTHRSRVAPTVAAPRAA
jgi:integrase